MKKQKINNIILLIVSIILAVLVWFVVNSIVQPIISDYVNAELKIQNADFYYDQGKSFEINNSKRVKVSYKVRSSDANKIKSSDFVVYVDAKEANFAGSVPVHYSVSAEAEKLISNIKLDPSSVTVSTETLSSKNYTIQAHTKGKLAEGKTIGSIIINPATIYVNGPKAELDQVKSVGIEINIDRAKENFSGTEDLTFYDKVGDPIKLDGLNTTIKKIEYTVVVFESKEVSFNALIDGTVASGHEYKGTVISPEKITITGPRNILENIDTIDIPTIFLDNVDRNIQKIYIIQDILPKGVEVLGDYNNVVVTVMIDRTDSMPPRPKKDQKGNNNEESETDESQDNNHIRIFKSADGESQSDIIYTIKISTNSEAYEQLKDYYEEVQK